MLSKHKKNFSGKDIIIHYLLPYSASSATSHNWKTRIRDLSPSRRSPSPKPDRKKPAKSPSKSVSK